MLYIRRFRAALAALTLLLVASTAHAAVWFGDPRGLHRVDSESNVVDLDVASGEPVAIAIDTVDGSVWSLTRRHIAKYTETGVLVFNRTLASYNPAVAGAGRTLAVNPADGSAWVGGDQFLFHLNRDGWDLSTNPESITDIELDADGTLWVLDAQNTELRRYDGDHIPISVTNVGGASGRASFIALDSARGALWLGADRVLVKRSLAQPSQVLRRIETSHVVNALSLDPETGDLWVLGNQSFHGYRPNGQLFRSESIGVPDPKTLVFDFDTRALWIGHRRGVSRFTRGGQKVATIRADEADTVAVSRAALHMQPTITGVTLAPGAVLTSRKPDLTFAYGAQCGAASCGFPPEFFSGYTIDATLDGIALPPYLFTYDAATATVTYRQTQSEGAHTIVVIAVDAGGRRSEPVVIPFTVDAFPPFLLTYSPTGGATFKTQPITLAGTYDETAVSVTLDGVGTQTGNVFSFQLPLRFGTNTYVLSAVDAVGNVESTNLTYTYDPPNALPTVRLLAPVAGTVYAQAPATVTLEAEAADSDGTIARVSYGRDGLTIPGAISTVPPYRVVVSVPPGWHTLVARADDNRGGFSLSAPVEVYVNSPPVVTLTAPVDGSTALGGVIVRAHIDDPDGGTRRVEVLRDGIVVLDSLLGSGPEFAAGLGGPLGVHTYAVRVTDDRGIVGTSATAQATVLPFTFNIASPLHGETVTRVSGTVRVTGTFEGPASTTIMVNGVPATLEFDADGYGGTYVAVIPMDLGAREILVELSSPEPSLGFGRGIIVTVVDPVP